MWTYEQSSGKLIDKLGMIIGIGYSGFEKGHNNPSMQEIKGIGPLPRGMYKIGTPFDSPDHGPFCLRLTPLADTQMFGRDGMLMHGDSKVHPGKASHGCIIQLHLTRIKVWESGDHLLEVTI